MTAQWLLDENRALRERLRETEHKLAAALYREAVAPPEPPPFPWMVEIRKVALSARTKQCLEQALPRLLGLRQAPAVLCRCGLSHPAPEWVKLPFVGLGGDEVERFELRNCQCGSTISRAFLSAPLCDCMDCQLAGEPTH